MSHADGAASAFEVDVDVASRAKQIRLAGSTDARKLNQIERQLSLSLERGNGSERFADCGQF
jgi:hypothetical protein